MNYLEYSLVRFSPSPEEIEAVNVAVLLWERPPRVLLDEDFPRLGSITQEFDASALQSYLLDMANRFGEANAAPGISSQVQLSARRRLFAPVTAQLEDLLKRRYLTKATPQRNQEVRIAEQALDTRLDTFLIQRLKVARSEWRVRQRPADFLPGELLHRYIPGDGLTVARVVSGRRHVLVIDGVNRNAFIGFTERRAMKIGAAFFALGQLKGDLLAGYGKELHRAVVFFGSRPERGMPRLDYVEATLGRDSDLPEEGGQPSAKLQEVAREAAADLL